MTVTTTTNSISYVGNGATTAFAFPYIFFAPTDLVVTLIVTATGIAVSPPPVLNGAATYDYTVSGVVTSGEYASGAVITFNNAPLGTHTVSIVRNVPATQTVTLIDNTKFPAETINTEFDKLTVLAQQAVFSGGGASPGGPAGGDLTGVYPNPSIRPSVALTGNPTAPTPTAGDNDTSIATTAFVTTAVATSVVTLYSESVTTGAATFIDAAVPATWKKLEIEYGMFTSDGSTQTGMLQQKTAGVAVGGTNYIWQYLYGTGVTVVANSAVAASFINLGTGIWLKGVTRPWRLPTPNQAVVTEGSGYVQASGSAHFAVTHAATIAAAAGQPSHFRVSFQAGPGLAVGSYLRCYVVT